MANQEHLKILKQGVDVWNKWRQEHPRIKPDLSNADLSRAILYGANFSKGTRYRESKEVRRNLTHLYDGQRSSLLKNATIDDFNP